MEQKENLQQSNEQVTKVKFNVDKYKLMSFIFLALGLIFGAFYREFTKFMNFTGQTQLSILHTHTLVLGFIIPFIISLDKHSRNKLLDKIFFILYNVGLIIVTLSFLTKGILQVTMTDFNTSSVSTAFSGISGLGHIVITAGFVTFITSYFYKTK